MYVCYIVVMSMRHLCAYVHVVCALHVSSRDRVTNIPHALFLGHAVLAFIT